MVSTSEAVWSATGGGCSDDVHADESSRIGLQMRHFAKNNKKLAIWWVKKWWSSINIWSFLFFFTSSAAQETLGRYLMEPLRTLGRAPKIVACPQALAQPMPMRLEIPEAGKYGGLHHEMGVTHMVYMYYIYIYMYIYIYIYIYIHMAYI